MGPPNTSTANALDPQEVLRFIVEKERLTKTLRHFEVTKEELCALLLEAEQESVKEEPPPKQSVKKAKKADSMKASVKSTTKKKTASVSKSKSASKVEAAKTAKTSKSSAKTTASSKETTPQQKKAEEGSEKKGTKETKPTRKKSGRRSVPRGRRNASMELEHYSYDRLLIYSDGAARGNPGESGAGVVLKTPEGEEVGRFGRYLGRKTNNYAEYQAVLLGLDQAQEFGASEVTILSDSDLLVRQLLGEYRVRAAHLRELFDQVKGLLSKFEKYQVKRINREKNAEADSMANRAIDEKL